MSDDLARGTVKKKNDSDLLQYKKIARKSRPNLVNPRKNGIKRVLCERANDLSLVMNVFVNV